MNFKIGDQVKYKPDHYNDGHFVFTEIVKASSRTVTTKNGTIFCARFGRLWGASNTRGGSPILTLTNEAEKQEYLQKKRAARAAGVVAKLTPIAEELLSISLSASEQVQAVIEALKIVYKLEEK